MTYEFELDPRALKEWHKLGETVQKQFKKKLSEVLKQPRVEANRLRELPNCYKIKLRQAGYRLIYQVYDEKVSILIVAIGKRNKSEAYKNAEKRV